VNFLSAGAVNLSFLTAKCAKGVQGTQSPISYRFQYIGTHAMCKKEKSPCIETESGQFFDIFVVKKMPKAQFLSPNFAYFPLVA